MRLSKSIRLPFKMPLKLVLKDFEAVACPIDETDSPDISNFLQLRPAHDTAVNRYSYCLETSSFGRYEAIFISASFFPSQEMLLRN